MNDYNLIEQLESDNTMTALEAVRLCLMIGWHKANVHIGIILPSQVMLKEFRELLSYEEHSVPDWIKSKTIRSNVQTMEFDSGSSILLKLKSNTFRGLTLNLVLIHRQVNIENENIKDMLPSLYSTRASIGFFN